jgi:hypothetical protein
MNNNLIVKINNLPKELRNIILECTLEFFYYDLINFIKNHFRKLLFIDYRFRIVDSSYSRTCFRIYNINIIYYNLVKFEKIFLCYTKYYRKYTIIYSKLNKISKKRKVVIKESLEKIKNMLENFYVNLFYFYLDIKPILSRTPNKCIVNVDINMKFIVLLKFLKDIIKLFSEIIIVLQ